MGGKWRLPFWEWLVLMYGDYGTSPRMGWIIPENVKPLKDFFAKTIKRHERLVI